MVTGGICEWRLTTCSISQQQASEHSFPPLWHHLCESWDVQCTKVFDSVHHFAEKCTDKCLAEHAELGDEQNTFGTKAEITALSFRLVGLSLSSILIMSQWKSLYLGLCITSRAWNSALPFSVNWSTQSRDKGSFYTPKITYFLKVGEGSDKWEQYPFFGRPEFFFWAYLREFWLWFGWYSV